jgi:parallel beta helix pectate lyase-like protein
MRNSTLLRKDRHVRQILFQELSSFCPLWLLIAVASPTQVYAQYVDCSGNDPNAFPTIAAALASADPGSWITVVGTCNENVAISNLSNIGLSSPWQQTATINGGISIQNSENINLYGLNVTNQAGDGIQVGHSSGVVLDTCSCSGNAGKGLSVSPASDVSINATGAFNNNGDSGIAVNDNSSL